MASADLGHYVRGSSLAPIVEERVSVEIAGVVVDGTLVQRSMLLLGRSLYRRADNHWLINISGKRSTVLLLTLLNMIRILVIQAASVRPHIYN